MKLMNIVLFMCFLEIFEEQIRIFIARNSLELKAVKTVQLKTNEKSWQSNVK